MDFKMYGKKNLEKSHLGNNCLNIAGCIEITLPLVFIFMGNNDHSFRKKGKKFVLKYVLSFTQNKEKEKTSRCSGTENSNSYTEAPAIKTDVKRDKQSSANSFKR